MQPKVIDLSHHNTVSPDLLAAKAAGIVGLIHKTSEGMGGVDEKFKSRKFLADQAEMKFGAYHFMRPGDPVAQAKFFINKCQGVTDENSLYVCDFEVDGISLEQVANFLAEVAQLTGKPPVLYSGHTLKELGGCNAEPRLAPYRLWLCQYYGPHFSLPAGYLKYWMWQYSDKGQVPGVGPQCDVNTFDGEDIDW